jgi:iron(III) transport system substrate-binding protein
MQVFRSVGIQTSSNTIKIFEQVEQGRYAMGYNLLASYAWRRQRAGAPIAIVYPRDYTLAVSRVAIIPVDAPHPDEAHEFLDFLVSPEGQRTLVTRSELAAVRSDVGRGFMNTADGGTGPLRPVSLGPGLLADLDKLKRQRLIELWERSVSRPDQRSGRAAGPSSP